MFCKNCGREVEQETQVCPDCGAKLEGETKPVKADTTLLTVAKIFIIIGMIFGFWMIVPLIIGIITLNKMKTAQCKNDILAMGILCVIFCSLIGGVCLLCADDESIKNYN